jgi:hypothetical protein
MIEAQSRTPERHAFGPRWHGESLTGIARAAVREARLAVQAGLSRQHQAFFIGAPQQFVNFGDVFPHFVHLNWSAIACHLLPAPHIGE